MQLAGSGNGTPPCHRPITEHAGRVRRQLPSDGNRRAVRGKRGGGGRDGGSGGGGGSTGGGAGGGEGRESGGRGALRDQSLQQNRTTQLPTPPTICCPRRLATTPPPSPLSSSSSSLKMPSYEQASGAGARRSPPQTNTRAQERGYFSKNVRRLLDGQF